MISRQEWDSYSEKEKLDYLFRQNQWSERALRTLAEAIDRLREDIRQQRDKTPPKNGDRDEP